MYKYKSKNELDTFYFHDHVVIKTAIKDNACIWYISRIDIMPTNSCSTFNILKAADNVMLTFNDCSYSNIEKHFGIIDGEPKIESVADARIEHMNEIIECMPLMGCKQVNMNNAIFEIFREDYFITFNVCFSSVTVEWNEFVDVYR